MLKTEGVVLRELRYRDTSKILSVYTKKYGKIAVMARGAYRPKSQIIANTQPFSYNEYQLYRGKNFFYLNQGDIIDSFYSIRERIERVTYGYYMLELIDKSIPEEQENEKLFNLLIKGLTVLSSLENDYLKFIAAYELKFISFLGYKPYLDKCVLCGSFNKNNIKFSIYEGGIICDNCFVTDPFSIQVNKEIYKGMCELLYTSLEKISDVVISKDSLYKIHEMIVEYILYNIDRKKFNSLNLIKSLQ
ncbi:DNA repair protein RecO [Tissierella carlieri]|jgi:DNA repair protein RecO (recombination protein O)|uniref:DNA repair protein RecO n=1 Tax=Tissierella carlieri TaxID=689904 RepID=UPI001C11FB18|nr:DNA repair protein RecO [Tissierella carlieri]MBU5313591.1 DNA repair protein RecO [Tissierella carlieri]MDU5080557.1 DNA repair protein RecO [Bacillota bacterium]